MEEQKQNEQQNRDHALTEKLNGLENDLEKLRQELTEEKNRHLRARADFDNYRKRIEREAAKTQLLTRKEILIDLLGFLDYFEQARKQIHDPAAAEGLEIMARQFRDLLHKQGVRPVECIGQPFDPEEQEGVGYIYSDQYQSGCVAEEVCCGYKLGDMLLKPAQVMVAKNE